MVTPLIRKSLEKQGYKLIGSHSGVKLCRWTKVDRSITANNLSLTIFYVLVHVKRSWWML